MRGLRRQSAGWWMGLCCRQMILKVAGGGSGRGPGMVQIWSRYGPDMVQMWSRDHPSIGTPRDDSGSGLKGGWWRAMRG
eukprot:9469621-Pyramimonas_sp.AAC.1